MIRLRSLLEGCFDKKFVKKVVKKPLIKKTMVKKPIVRKAVKPVAKKPSKKYVFPTKKELEEVLGKKGKIKKKEI